MQRCVKTGIFRGAQVLRVSSPRETIESSSERGQRQRRGDGGGTQRNTQVLVVPGNPGLADFYARFLNELSCRIENGKGGNEDHVADIHCVGHRNHIGRPRDALVALNCAHRCVMLDKELQQQNVLFHDDASALIGLDAQIEHQRAYLEHIVERENTNVDVDLVVVGHSIGAWIANEALRRALPHIDTNIRSLKFILLMPFLEADLTQARQRLIHFVSSVWLLRQLTGILVWLMRVLLPISIRRALFAHFLEPAMCETSVSLVARTLASTPSFIANCLHLVRDEFRALRRQADGRGVWATTLRDLRHHLQQSDTKPPRRTEIAFLFARDDDWSPSPMMHAVKDMFQSDSNVTIQYDEHVSHSFCTNAREAARCAAWIRDLL